MRRRAESLALAAYLVLQVFLALHHEPWRDEADTWLIARDASPAGLMRLMPYDGNPSLWFWLLVPPAKLGLPILAQQLIHLALAFAAGALFVLRSPFPLAIRLLGLFGFYLSFEYAAVSRHYVLTSVLLFALASFYTARAEKPLGTHGVIGLLANANAHSFLLAGALFAFEGLGQLRRRIRRSWRPFLVSASGLTLALWQLWPPKDGQFPPDPFITFHRQALADVWAGAFVPDYFGILATSAGLIVAALGVISLRRQPRLAALLLCGWAALLYVLVFKYISGLRHCGMVLLWFLFCLWIAQRDDPEGWSFKPVAGADPVRRWTLWALAVSLAVSVATATRYWYLEYRYAFSEGTDMAEFIQHSGLANRPIAAHPAPNATSVLAQLPKRTFWYPGIEADGSYMKWDRAYAAGLRVSLDEAIRRVRRHFGGSGEALLLLNQPLTDPEGWGYRLLHATPGRIFAYQDERFFLYEPVRAP